MGELNARVDIKKLISLGEDLIGVLNTKKDVESLMQSVEAAKTLHVATQSDDQEVQVLLEEYHKRINACKEKIDETRSGTVADGDIELDKFQRKNTLWEELRVIHEELDRLECKRISIEEQKELVKNREKDLLRAQLSVGTFSAYSIQSLSLASRVSLKEELEEDLYHSPPLEKQPHPRG